jgi:hypothetical protein
VITWTSCSESTPVGGGLLDDEDFDIAFEGITDIGISTTLADPSVTYTRLNFFNTVFLLGELDDPEFGKSSSSLACEVALPGLLTGLGDITIDSLVLMMEFADDGFYGDPDALHTLRVYRLLERINDIDTVFADKEYMFDTNPIGILPDYKLNRDSMLVYNANSDTTALLTDVVRIPMDFGFAQEVFGDSLNLENEESFQSALNGIYITSEVDGSGMFGMDLSSLANNSVMALYYTDDGGEDRQLNFLLSGGGSTRAMKQEHDYTGTAVEQALDVNVSGDEPVFVQGMSGVHAKVDLSSLRDLDNAFINHAEIEFFVAYESMGDTSLYPPVVRLGVLRANESGSLVLIDDLFSSILNSTIDISFGGSAELDENLLMTKYAMNITSHAKQIYTGNADPIIYITVFDKAQRPERLALFGPEHSQYPASLKVTYTKS